MTRPAPHISAALRQAVFFNPRTQRWSDHFRLEGAQIVPPTPEARVTVAILQLNHSDRLIERQRLIQVGRYP